MNISRALTLLLEHEGGYSDHPRDKGGKTRYGITEKVARDHGYEGDMKDFPWSTAEFIYRVDYWDKIRADQLPAELRFHVFDCAVNSGPARAIRILQKCAGVESDGIIGKVTIAAAQNVTPKQYTEARREFMRGLKDYDVFGKGWENRLNKNLRLAKAE